MSAATAPAAGSTPSRLGPVGSGFVATKRDPRSISRMAVVIASNE